MSRSKSLQNCYFVLYDLNDNLQTFFDNFEELSRITNVPRRNIAYCFNRNYEITGNNYICIKVYGKLYKLYKYEKGE